MQIHDALRLFVRSRLAANRRASTIEQYVRIIDSFASRTGLTDLDSVTPALVRDYLADRAGVWRPNTQAGHRDCLVGFLRWCAEEELIAPQNWGRRIPKVHVDRAPPKRLTPEQVGRLLTAAELFASKRDQAIIHLLLDTGLRSGELLGLRIADVDLDERSVRVDCACKGRAERHVWFTPETARRLRSYLRGRRRRSPYLFVSRSNGALSRDYLLWMVKHIAREAGIHDMTVHRLRHTALTALAEAGMSPILLQKLAGHASIQTTMIYARPDDRAVREEYERVSGNLRASA